MRNKVVIASLATILAFGSFGCTGKTASHSAKGHTHSATDVDEKANAEIAGERAKLIPEDRALVDAQEWCVVMSNERLGSMGPPIKLEVGGQAVFICCKGCRKKALAHPAKTLAKLEELKSKKKQESGQR